MKLAPKYIFFAVLVLVVALLAGGRLFAEPDAPDRARSPQADRPLVAPTPVVTPGAPADEPTAVTVQTVDSEQIGIVDAGGGPEFGPESGGGLPDGDVGGGAPETDVQQQAQAAVWETHADGSRHCLANCPTGNRFEPVEGAPMGQRIPGAPQPQWETRADGVTVCTANCGGSDETQAAGDINRGGGYAPPEQ